MPEYSGRFSNLPKSHSDGGAEIKKTSGASVSKVHTLHSRALQPSGQTLSFCGQAALALKSNSTTYDTSSIQVFTYKVGMMIIHTS